jgi:hypothetical protein
MILTAHQPAYLPWLGYYHKVALADVFAILDSVQYEKNSYINRNRIKTSNGETWLTIPVEMKGHLERTIRDVRIDSQPNWRKKHWNSLLLNYRKAACFNRYADFFEHYYRMETCSLSEFIEISGAFLLKELNIAPRILKLSEMAIESKKQELIIDLCKTTGANVFVFGPLGRNYATADMFEKNGISIYFQEYSHPSYAQLWGDFAQYMSIVDPLFNLGAERTRELIFEGNISKKELEVTLGGKTGVIEGG